MPIQILLHEPSQYFSKYVVFITYATCISSLLRGGQWLIDCSIRKMYTGLAYVLLFAGLNWLIDCSIRKMYTGLSYVLLLACLNFFPALALLFKPVIFFHVECTSLPLVGSPAINLLCLSADVFPVLACVFFLLFFTCCLRLCILDKGHVGPNMGPYTAYILWSLHSPV